jgi:hypothetical protein
MTELDRLRNENARLRGDAELLHARISNLEEILRKHGEYPCPHGNASDHCNACMTASDFAFDCQREQERFGR